jgi:lipopolysaccharide export system permease protein
MIRLFDRALIKEMAIGASMAFTALAAIFAVVLLVRVMARSAVGELAEDAVFPMLGFGFLRFLPILLSLSLFIGVFMSLSRLWRDSEAVIWMNGGIGPLDWMRPVMMFALPAVVAIGFVSSVLIPWSVEKQSRFEDILQSRDQVSSLSPGVFSEDRQGRRVFFVETVSENGTRVGNVFVQSSQQGRMGVIVAHQGRIQTAENGDRFLVLEQGHRYEGTPGVADFRVGDFTSYAVRIQPRVVAALQDKPRMRSVTALFADPSPENRGELVQRFGVPTSALLLCLLAVPLSYVNPRAGRSLNMVFAILIYASYNNFIGLSQEWVQRSAMSATQSLVLVHGGMLLLMAVAYWHRFRGPAPS